MGASDLVDESSVDLVHGSKGIAKEQNDSTDREVWTGTNVVV